MAVKRMWHSVLVRNVLTFIVQISDVCVCVCVASHRTHCAWPPGARPHGACTGWKLALCERTHAAASTRTRTLIGRRTNYQYSNVELA